MSASPTSVMRASRGVHRGRHIGLQRLAGARRKEDEPRPSGWFLLHLLALVRRAKRFGALLQWQQSPGFAWRLRAIDFDRTHVFNIDYHYEFPKFFPATWEGKIADGWAFKVWSRFKVASPTAWSIIPGPSEASTTASTTGSPIPSCLWLPVVHPKTRSPARSATISPSGLKASCFTVPLLYPCNRPVANPQQADGSFPCSAIPAGDLRDQFHPQRRAAQHLPPALAEACGHLHRESDSIDGAVFVEVQLGRL